MKHFQKGRSQPTLSTICESETYNTDSMSTHTNQRYEDSQQTSEEKSKTKIHKSPISTTRQPPKGPQQDIKNYKKQDNKPDGKKHLSVNSNTKVNFIKKKGNEKSEQVMSTSTPVMDTASGDAQSTGKDMPKYVSDEKHAEQDGVLPVLLNEESTEENWDQYLSQFETPTETNVEIYGTPTHRSDSSLNEIESLTQDYIDDIDNNLPSTTVLLTTTGGSKVYVVGTVHFSLESQEEVAKVIRAVRPDYVVLELCSARAYMLHWDEEQILKEAQNLNLKLVKHVIQTSGLVQGGLHLILLSVANQITKQLGIAPGGEFRRAYKEMSEIPSCMVWFGDRPLQITMRRMLASLSIWQIIKLVFVVLFTEEMISKEEVEKCKDQDVLERMILGFSKEMPEFAKVMVVERDLFLTYNLQLAAQNEEPKKVVGVVGIGHLAGIQKNWGRVSLSQVQEVLTIPPPKLSLRIFKFTLKFTSVGLILYGVHKMASKSTFYSNLFSDQSYWNLSNMMFDIWDSPVIQT